MDIFVKRPARAEDLQSMLAEMREQVAARRDEYLEPDVRRVLEDDYFLERYLFRFEYEPAGALAMVEAYLRWHSQLPKQVHADFPLEFYQYSAMFTYEPDRAGHRTVYGRIRLNRRIERFLEVQRLWILKCLFAAEAEATVARTGLVLVLDCTDMGLVNIDMPMLYFLLETFIKYMPGLLRYILVYNLPRLYYYLAVAGRAFFPARYHNMLQFASGDQIFDFIDRDHLPPYLGGQCGIDHYRAPAGARSYKNFDQFQDLTVKENDEIYKVFEPLLQSMQDEAKRYFPENHKD